MWETLADELNGSFAAVAPGISAIRLVAAIALGGAIGFEREHRNKPAGLRTHMLISMAACLFILISLQLGSMNFAPEGELQIDPLRLIEAVTAGVAFLAAGIIFTAGGRVRNITTGASMWLAGAVGVACGSGQIPLAVMATFIVLVVIVVLGAIERRYWPNDRDEPSQ